MLSHRSQVAPRSWHGSVCSCCHSLMSIKATCICVTHCSFGSCQLLSSDLVAEVWTILPIRCEGSHWCEATFTASSKPILQTGKGVNANWHFSLFLLVWAIYGGFKTDITLELSHLLHVWSVIVTPSWLKTQDFPRPYHSYLESHTLYIVSSIYFLIVFHCCFTNFSFYFSFRFLLACCFRYQQQPCHQRIRLWVTRNLMMARN